MSDTFDQTQATYAAPGSAPISIPPPAPASTNPSLVAGTGLGTSFDIAPGTFVQVITGSGAVGKVTIQNDGSVAVFLSGAQGVYNRGLMLRPGVQVTADANITLYASLPFNQSPVTSSVQGRVSVL